LIDGSTIPVVMRSHHWHMKRRVRIPLWMRQALGHPKRPHALAQQILGSGSPISMSTTRVPPKPV
jgi:hypothetical protein